MRFKIAAYLFVFFGFFPFFAQSQTMLANKICGKWITTEKNLIIQIYKHSDNFKTKILWFKNDKSTKDIHDYRDEKNPNPELRERKIVGMEIVDGLKYNEKTNSWENGKIYDAHHGRFWDSSAVISDEGFLKVTGYWKFKWIGKTLTFTRM